MLFLLALAILPAILAILFSDMSPVAISRCLWSLSVLGACTLLCQRHNAAKLERQGARIVPLLRATATLLEMLGVRRTRQGIAFGRDWLPLEVEANNPLATRSLDVILQIAEEIGKENVVVPLIKDKEADNLDKNSGDTSGIFSGRSQNV